MKSKRKSETHNFLKSMGHSKSSSKRKVYRDPGLYQETRKISNKQPNLPFKGLRKEQSPKSTEGRR